MANGIIRNYTVNLVATSSNADVSTTGRRKRQATLVSECVDRNGRGVDTDVTVPGDMNSLALNDLGESAAIDNAQFRTSPYAVACEP